jgi:hypothetical protein
LKDEEAPLADVEGHAGLPEVDAAKGPTTRKAIPSRLEIPEIDADSSILDAALAYADAGGER